MSNLNQATRHSDVWAQVNKHALDVNKHVIALLQNLSDEGGKHEILVPMVEEKLVPRQEKIACLLDEVQKTQEGGKFITQEKYKEVKEAAELFNESLLDVQEGVKEDALSTTLVEGALRYFIHVIELLEVILAFTTENEATA